jgi:hypothetical protein
MRGECSTGDRHEKVIEYFNQKKLDGRPHFGDQSVGEAVILCKVQ